MPHLPQALRRLTRPFSRERDLRMVWQVARRGARSRLVGTAHFFPYHFRGALRRLIGAARTVLLEGPLDEPSMRRVRDAGSGAVHVSLYHALDAATRERVCRALGLASPRLDSPILAPLFFGRPVDWLEEELRSLKPWMAFFGLWSRYRLQQGGNYSLDLDAQRIALALGKELRHLESVEEQIAALDAVPLERILHFMNQDWPRYCAAYERHYLDGDLDGLLEAARAFPTFCEAVIERRDARLAERMALELERGEACVFVGVTHCPGVLARLRADGFTVQR